ncbi:MAG: ribosomal protein S18-alanine N-acetyltransferase [Acidimicrobiia bacterium]
MRRRHLRAVLQIETDVYPSGWTRGIFLNELLQTQTRGYWVAKVGRQIVGYVGVMFGVDEGHITTIAVHREWQRQKVATRLMIHAMRETIAREYDALTLEARVSNTGAHALYEQFGLQSVGVRPGYYADNREDAVVMWAHGLLLPEYVARLDAISADCDAVNTVEGS